MNANQQDVVLANMRFQVDWQIRVPFVHCGARRIRRENKPYGSVLHDSRSIFCRKGAQVLLNQDESRERIQNLTKGRISETEQKRTEEKREEKEREGRRR